MTSSLAAPLARATAAHEQSLDARSGAHLADASFRFDTDAPRTATTRPLPGQRWTLPQTLQEIRLRGAEIARTTMGLRVRHAHLATDLASAVALHEEAVRTWLDLGSPAPVGGWDDETMLRLRWAERRFQTQTQAVTLRPGVSVTDWARFRESLLGRFAEGPDAPCADSVRRDLADLFIAHARPMLRRVHRRTAARAA